MAESRAIKRLLRNLEAIKAQSLTFNDNTRISEIKTCLALLADEWKEFQGLERSLKGKFDEAHLDSVDKIENTHLELKRNVVRWEKLYEENNSSHGNNTMDELVLNQTNFLHEISNLNKRDTDVRLPRVNIPPFAGKYSEFPSFRDLFEASIHNNSNMSKVHKLQYLKGLLKGEAYALINHITVTDAHYDEAWDKVKTRYNKRKHVVHLLLKQFMDQSNLHQSCVKSLRQLSDVSDEVVRGLKVLGEQAEGRDPWLIYILINKLDDASKEAWAHETADIDFPTLEQLFNFLNKRCDALESLSSIIKPKPGTSKRVSCLTKQSNIIMCQMCSGDHYLAKCDKFLDLPTPERKQYVAEKKLCFNCLSSTHQSTVCRSRYNCRLCKRRHHVTLHPASETTNIREGGVQNINEDIEIQTASHNTIVDSKSTGHNQLQAILPTAIVLVKDRSGNMQRCRVLLDSGSESSFVSEACAQRLQLQRQRANVNITGITTGSVKSKGKAIIILRSVYNPNFKIKVDALVINHLPSNIPSCDIDVGEELFQNLELADPDYGRSAPIDILIGADIFFSILENGRKQFNSFVLQNTIFGWIVSGQTKSKNNMDSLKYMSLNIQLNFDIDTTLRQFWEIEETPQTNMQSPEDLECEDFFYRDS